jgi:hypothetical protein
MLLSYLHYSLKDFCSRHTIFLDTIIEIHNVQNNTVISSSDLVILISESKRKNVPFLINNYNITLTNNIKKTLEKNKPTNSEVDFQATLSYYINIYNTLFPLINYIYVVESIRLLFNPKYNFYVYTTYFIAWSYILYYGLV